MGLGKRRSRQRRLLEVVGRFRRLAQARRDNAQVVVGLDLGRIQLQHAPIASRGLGQPVKSPQHGSEIVMHLDEVRPQLDARR